MESKGNKFLITHNDLDGVGCAIILLKCFPDIQVKFVDDHRQVNEIIMDLIVTEGTDISLWITDLSPNEDVASSLNELKGINLIDHHKTAKWLEKYPWSLIDTKCSATKLVYELMSNTHILSDYCELVNIIDNYDMWGYSQGPTETSKELNNLLKLIGVNMFIKKFVKNSEVIFTEPERFALDLEKAREIKYLNDTISKVKIHQDSNGNTYGLLASEQYTSELGSYILSVNNIDYVVIVNLRESRVSLRSKGRVDVSLLAKECNGGGHPKAAGFSLEHAVTNSFIPKYQEMLQYISYLEQKVGKENG